MKMTVFRLDETIRRLDYALLSSAYTVEGKDEKVLAAAEVQEGVIQTFACSPSFEPHIRALVMGGMLKAIIEDADHINSNLSIELVEEHELMNRRFLERFGFRRNHGDMMIRIAGSIRPPTVV